MKRPSLNHRYRLIWSRIQHAWVAVAEHVKSDGKHATASRDNSQATSLFSSKALLALTKKTQLTLVVLSALLGVSQNVYAQWTDLTIESGQAVTEQAGNNLTINVATSRVVGAASSLDIAANENVNVFFELGGGTGLFRSTGNSATSIYGSLNSNGNLFLINQNGVLFGQSAQVDVGGLVASSMNISNADFLQGNYQFNVNGSANGVANQGVIKVSDGGYLVLLGKEVSNSGTLVANQGSVVLASADSAVLDFYGNGLVKANLSGDALEAVVEQSGVIQADGGAVQLATNSRSSAVNVSGLVQANSLVERNGVIRLEGGNNAQVAVSGTLNAKGNETGTTGGNIEAAGEQVALFSSANLDASGDAGGGQVLVGGDYQGKNSEVYNARTTYVDQSASINVGAKQIGDGGKAIVWAEQATRYYGDISAKGGAVSGNGGFVEVSGKQSLDFIGSVDVSATNGLGGNVLLDPENIILSTTGVTPPNNLGTPDFAFMDNPGTTTTVLINGVIGFNELFLQANNDITVANNIFMATDNSIRLEANNNINVNGQVFTQGTGDITLTADADAIGGGDLLLNRRVVSRAGNITLSGANVAGAGQVLTQGLGLQDSGNVLISASQDINLTNSIVTNGRGGAAGLNGTDAGNVTLTAGGAINTANIVSSGGNGGNGAGSNANGGDAGAINIASTGAGDVSIGSLSSRNGAGRGAGVGGTSGSISVTNASGDITTKSLDTYGNTNGDGGNVTVAAAAGDVTVNGRIYTYGGGVISSHTLAGRSGGDINITGVNRTIISRINANGNTARGVDQDGGNAGVITITGSGTLNTKDIYTRTGSATGTGGGGSEGSITLTGSTITSTGTIHTAGSRNGAGGNINLTSTAGNITTTTVYANGGGANSGNEGNDAGTVTINSAGSLTATSIYASGSSGNGIDQAGGSAGTIDIDAVGAITTANIVSSGGNGGNGAGSNANGGDAGAINIASTGAGDVTTANITARSGYARGAGTGTAGSVDIQNDNGALTIGNISTRGQRRGFGGDIKAVATGGNITTGNVDARASNLTAVDGGKVTLVSTTGDVSVADIKTGDRWLVYSGDPRNDTIGAFKASADFKQYNTNYGDVLLDVGNGFVYRYAPMIAGTLTGSASKIYDGNANVNSIAGLTFNQGAAIDGDIVTLSAFTSATYNNKNAGADKTLTSNAVMVTGASNGGTQVYGYQANAATGNVGEVTQRGITVSAVTDTKAYDGNTSSVGMPLITSGFVVGGDTVNLSQAFDNKDVGTGKALSATSSITDGNGGNNYAVTYVADNTGIITGSLSNPSGVPKPRDDAGLVFSSPTQEAQQFLAVFGVNATVAGGGPEAEVCESDQGKKLNNFNMSLMLNFGVNLPEGVKKTCVF